MTSFQISRLLLAEDLVVSTSHCLKWSSPLDPKYWTSVVFARPAYLPLLPETKPHFPWRKPFHVVKRG